MNVRVLTFVYGRYLEWFEKSFRSLMWPLNRKALEGAVWSIYTTEEDEWVLREMLEPLVKVEFHRIVVGQKSIGEQFSDCLVDETRICVSKKAGMLLAPPDTIFGDGTIHTLVKLGSEGMNAISVPHPRVLAEAFPDLKEPTSNAKLVGFAMEHMHQVWRLANMELKNNNAFYSGAGWREISQNLYAVSMRIPTPYFVRPEKRDIDSLIGSGAGGWDHKWPQHLVKEQRHRVIGSSDAAFMVELSPADLPQGGTKERNLDDIDAYRGGLLHHQVNRNTVAIWRAE